MQSLVKILVISLLTFFLIVGLSWSIPIQDLRKGDFVVPLAKQDLNNLVSCVQSSLRSSLRGKKVAVYDSAFDFISDVEAYRSYLIGINEPEWTEKYLIRPEPREVVEYDTWLNSLFPFVDRINRLPLRRKEERFHFLVVTLDGQGKCKSDFQPTQSQRYFSVVIAKLNLDYMEREAKIPRKERLALVQRALNEMAKRNAGVSSVNRRYLQDNPSLIRRYFYELAYLTEIEVHFFEQLGLTVPQEIFRI